jgi:hypothetical protein
MAAPDELEKYHNLYRVNIDKIWKGKQKKEKSTNGNGGGNGNGKELTKLAVYKMFEKEAVGKKSRKK